MPLPRRKPEEEQDDFIGRCMSQLKEEFPKRKQRLAVCFTQWRKGSKK